MSEEISLHYSTIYPTNKPASDSIPNASYKHCLISSLGTSSFTYLLTILTHPGKNGMAHLPPTSTLSSNGSSPHSSPPRTSPSLPPYSVNLAYALVVLAYSAHAHKLPQILSLQWRWLAGMLSKGSAFTKTSPTSSCTRPLAHYLTSPSTQPPTFSNPSSASSLILLTSHVLHPLLPQTASITSSHWFLIRAHAVDSNSTSTITYLTHFTMKSSPMLPTTSISSQAYFLLRHPTFSSDYVAATHTTASSTGNLTQAPNVNYVSLYTRLPTNQFVHVEQWSIFLVTTSSNAHASA